MRSVLEQDYPRIEYLVADGGSEDGSVDIIRKYANELAWWVSEKDNGQADAINKGLSRVKGDIIAWLNSDDYYLPGTISAAVVAFDQHPETVMIYANMLAVDEHGRVINEFKYRQLTLEDLLCFQIIGQPAVFFRREALEKVGMLDSTFHFMLDHQFWIRLASLGPILHVPQIWAAARYHPRAKNRAQASAFGKDAFRIWDWASRKPNLAPVAARVSRRARASAHRVDARYLLDGGQPLAALKAWMSALFIHPPTAFARLNILASALLNILGLNKLRDAILHRRQQSYSRGR